MRAISFLLAYHSILSGQAYLLESFRAPSRLSFPPSLTFLSAAKKEPSHKEDDAVMSRRSVLFTTVTSAAALLVTTTPALAAGPNGLPLTTAPRSGLKWADAKVGTGQPLTKGAAASIDYSMASTAGRFPQIYTTKDKGTPYRWTLGDDSTIAGIELAILGDDADNIPAMLPGGIRRVIIPSSLGYASLVKSNTKCSTERGAVGPIPPKEDAAFQRWVQFYCNPRIPYQPDLVLDIKLYGKRT